MYICVYTYVHTYMFIYVDRCGLSVFVFSWTKPNVGLEVRVLSLHFCRLHALSSFASKSVVAGTHAPQCARERKIKASPRPKTFVLKIARVKAIILFVPHSLDSGLTKLLAGIVCGGLENKCCSFKQLHESHLHKCFRYINFLFSNCLCQVLTERYLFPGLSGAHFRESASTSNLHPEL